MKLLLLTVLITTIFFAGCNTNSNLSSDTSSGSSISSSSNFSTASVNSITSSEQSIVEDIKVPTEHNQSVTSSSEVSVSTTQEVSDSSTTASNDIKTSASQTPSKDIVTTSNNSSVIIPPIEDLETNLIDYLPWPKDLGDYFGRLYIPSANISVACYNKLSISICDDEDSACLARYRQTIALCADHNYQSFSTLKEVKVGDFAYLLTNSGTVKFVCIEAFEGKNDIENITDNNGNTVGDNFDMMAYTCKTGWTTVYIRGFVIVK